MITIFSSKICPRLSYTLQLIFESILQLPFQVTDSKALFTQQKGITLNYSNQKIPADFWFYPNELLFERNINLKTLKVSKYNGLPTFFTHNHPEANLPFDPFAMIFYLVSRYEEYTLPSEELDLHHRFPAKKSLAFQNDFLKRPLVDELCIFLKVFFSNKKHLAIPEKKFTYLPTYDVDYAWAYQNKGFLRNLGGGLRELIQRDLDSISLRLKVLMNRQNDPYFTFDYLNALHQQYHLSPIYFFLVADHGKFDKNIPVSNPNFQQIIQQTASKYTVGIHPSYQSHQSSDILKKEVQRLSSTIRQPIVHSRQHYLKFTLPTTYRNLIEMGIQQDYTMGYAEKTGFRASTATPFFWFDLEKNTPTSLLITPFQVMDVTLNHYENYSFTQAYQEILELVTVTKKVGGTFSSLWHNNSFCEREGWKGWKNVYEQMIRACL